MPEQPEVRLDQVWRRAEDLTVEALGDQTVVFDPSRSLHRLDPAATAVWRRLDGTADLAAVAGAVAAHVGAEPEAVARDVLGLVARLAEIGLVRLVHPSIDGSPLP